MLLSTLTLATAVSALALSSEQHDKHSNKPKDVFKKCTIIRSHDGSTVYDCPGCTLIIDKDGTLRLRTGRDCDKYTDDPDDKEVIMQDKDCQILKQPDGDTLIQCPGCQKIIDKDGNTKLEQGSKCHHGKEEIQTILKEVYESELLTVQGL